MFKYASLTPDVLHILQDKGTEPPGSGPYIDSPAIRGSYLCKGCGQALFREDSQFTSHCGWPSFDDQLPDKVALQPDADGRRTEIVCSQCQGHLGHVFSGENYTVKNTRYCVNGLAIEFVPAENVLQTEEVIVAAGCFWGVEHLLKQERGALLTEVGYLGGHVDQPSYEQVCRHDTGHVEAVRVVFDTAMTNLQTILQCFFEIHDFTQQNGQGPDLGSQYLSAIFYFNDKQKIVAEELIKQLQAKGYQVVTSLRQMQTFWPAEAYHQAYYQKNGKAPYCHMRRRVF